MSTETLLQGVTLARGPSCAAPVIAAASLLEGFGASVIEQEGHGGDVLVVRAAGRPTARARLTDWRGEETLPVRPAQGAVLSAYVALRLAGAAAAAAGRGVDARLSARALANELSGPLRVRGGMQPELLRCRDGWLVVRWRDEHEPALLRALVGAVHECPQAEAVQQARLARILIAPVTPPPTVPDPPAVGADSLDGFPSARSSSRRPRVLDWSVLWAGPWATAQLGDAGAVVDRVEHPRRRDGLLAFESGRRWWRTLNGRKHTRLLDARDARDRRRLERAIAGADVLVTSMTPPALGALGFSDDWRRERAPHLLHLELVAFEPPWADAPGLGEHAAAQAGLLWRSGDCPAPAHPWADPLLGAAALAVARIWLACGERRGGRVRLSLERAASLAHAVGRASP